VEHCLWPGVQRNGHLEYRDGLREQRFSYQCCCDRRLRGKWDYTAERCQFHDRLGRWSCCHRQQCDQGSAGRCIRCHRHWRRVIRGCGCNIRHCHRPRRRREHRAQRRAGRWQHDGCSDGRSQCNRRKRHLWGLRRRCTDRSGQRRRCGFGAPSHQCGRGPRDIQLDGCDQRQPAVFRIEHDR